MKGNEHVSPAEAVEGRDGIYVIRGSADCRAWNGIRYKLGLSAKNVGAKELSMNVATIPPRGVAGAHVHVGFEVMLYILQGRVRHAYGPGLRNVVDNEAGDFIFIEPGVPHEVYNLSDAEPVVAVVARSAPDEWDRIVPYDPAADEQLPATDEGHPAADDQPRATESSADGSTHRPMPGDA
jgi:uncharacterized RmlC-like cupin family protein